MMKNALAIALLVLATAAGATKIVGDGVQVECPTDPGNRYDAPTNTLHCPKLTPPAFYGGFEQYVPDPDPDPGSNICTNYRRVSPTHTNKPQPAGFGSAWPAFGKQAKPRINHCEFVAMAFVYREGQAGAMQWETGHLGGGSKVVSISQTPGDFSEGLGACIKASAVGALDWGTVGCLMTPGEVYYLNVVFRKTIQDATSTCLPGQECDALLQNSSF